MLAESHSQDSRVSNCNLWLDIFCFYAFVWKVKNRIFFRGVLGGGAILKHEICSRDKFGIALLKYNFRKSIEDDCIRRVIHYISLNISQKISIEELTKLASIRQTTFLNYLNSTNKGNIF